MSKLCHSKTFFLTPFILSNFSIEGTKVQPGKLIPVACDHIEKGILTLFSQSYSEVNEIPNNVFIAKLPGNKIYDKLYSAIYGTLRPEISLNISKALKYKVTRDSCLLPCSLFSAADKISGYGVNGYTVDVMKCSELYPFCKATSIPLIHYKEQVRRTGSLYVCNLVPMVRCTYQISIDIKTDDPQSFIELITPGSKLILQKIDDNTILKSYFKDSSGYSDLKLYALGAR